MRLLLVVCIVKIAYFTQVYFSSKYFLLSLLYFSKMYLSFWFKYCGELAHVSAEQSDRVSKTIWHWIADQRVDNRKLPCLYCVFFYTLDIVPRSNNPKRRFEFYVNLSVSIYDFYEFYNKLSHFRCKRWTVWTWTEIARIVPIHHRPILPKANMGYIFVAGSVGFETSDSHHVVSVNMTQLAPNAINQSINQSIVYLLIQTVKTCTYM